MWLLCMNHEHDDTFLMLLSTMICCIELWFDFMSGIYELYWWINVFLQSYKLFVKCDKKEPNVYGLLSDSSYMDPILGEESMSQFEYDVTNMLISFIIALNNVIWNVSLVVCRYRDGYCQIRLHMGKELMEGVQCEYDQKRSVHIP